MDSVIILFLGAVFAGVLTAVLAHRKGRNPWAWLPVGFCFLIVACILVACLPKVDPQNPGVASKLQELQTLRAQSLISEEEYATKRATLLQQI
ncbi:MAG: SHOCT domain-containing protein [Candidatus Binatia bacterium]